jgi:dTMP kinase
VIKPALANGDTVISDRYVDSSLAYQGVGRSLTTGEIARISRWATEGLVPHLTVVLDVAPAVGLARGGGPADRLEAEPEQFHERVRQCFLALAAAAPTRYLVIDATLPPERVSALIRDRLRGTLPLSETEAADLAAATRVEEQRAEAERIRVAAEQQAVAEQRRAAEARRQAELAQIREAEEAQKAERARRRAESKNAAAAAKTAAAVRAAREKAEADARRKAEDADREAAERARREAEHTRRVAEARARRAAQAEAREAEREAREAAEAEQRRLEEEAFRREQAHRTQVSLADDIFAMGRGTDDTIEIPRDRQ